MKCQIQKCDIYITVKNNLRKIVTALYNHVVLKNNLRKIVTDLYNHVVSKITQNFKFLFNGEKGI